MINKNVDKYLLGLKIDYSSKDWKLDEDITIVDCILNKKIKFINELEEILNKDIFHICERVLNVLNFKKKVHVYLKCTGCDKHVTTTPTQILKGNNLFCSKQCSNEYKKGKIYHSKIDESNCLLCGSKFDIMSNVPEQKFCSKKCKSKYYTVTGADKINTNCANCNKSIMKNKKQIKRYNNSYCSLECELEYKHKNSHKVKNCEICQLEFECRESSDQKFCSIQCQSKWQSQALVGENANTYNHTWSKEDRTTKCEWCGKEHIAKIHQIKNGRKFCSDQCRQEWFSKKFSQTDEFKNSSRERTVSFLESGRMKNTNTGCQVKTNNILDNLGIKYKNEKGFNYCAVDNYLYEHNLIIEVMGTYWHCDNRIYPNINYAIQVKRIKMDKIKHKNIKKDHNIEILYLWEKDINDNPDLIMRLISLYVDSKGILNNYHSFNYDIINDKCVLNEDLIIPYMEWDKSDLNNIIDTRTKEKISRKNKDKTTIFNCDFCGKEKQQFTLYYNKAKNHYCSPECKILNQRKLLQVK